MRALVACLAMILVLACSGGGGGGGGATGAPALSNFVFTPDTAVQNQGGGAVTVSVTLDFVTPRGDGANLLLSQGGESATLPLGDLLTGVHSGTIVGTLDLHTTQAGVFTVQAQLLTSHGTASNIVSETFTVTERSWQLQSLSPNPVVAGGPDFTLTVTGTGFQPGFWVQWNGDYLATTYVSATTLQVQVPASRILAPGTVQVSVHDPAYGLDAALPLTVTAGGSQVAVVVLPTNDLAWDPARQVIYASVPGSAGAQGNAIAVIDPAGGSVTRTVYAGSEPGRLALSGDGAYLYAGIDGAGCVQRFQLPGLTPDLTIPLGSGPYGAGPNHALDLQVAPGAPATLAVATGSTLYSPSYTGLTIFDGATPRATSVPSFQGTGYLLDSLQWGADAGTLFALNSESTGYDLYRVTVDAAGATVVQDIPAGLGPGWTGGLHYLAANGCLYGDSGWVVDTATLQRVGLFGQAGPMIPDPVLGFAYFLDTSAFSSSFLGLRSFDLATYTAAASHSIPVTALAGNLPLPSAPRRVIRWGAEGLAFGGGGGPLYLVTGTIVTGP